MPIRWYALVDHEVVGPFSSSHETDDWRWYHEHGGPDWRANYFRRTGVDPWQVECTDLGNGHCVSTVFLGLDHWWMMAGDDELNGPPMVFETLVLPDCDHLTRYSTWDAAVAGHWSIVAECVVTL